MKEIIYTRSDDNGVSVVYAAPKEVIEQVLGPLTQEQYEAHVWERSVPLDAINARFINHEDLPINDEFRDAWIDDGEKITHDLEKAKNIQIEKLRRERDKIILEYDNKIKAFEDIEDHKNARILKSKRVELRDMTNDLKQLKPKSLDDIKNVMPSLEPYRNPDKVLNTKRQAKHQNQNAAAGA